MKKFLYLGLFFMSFQEQGLVSSVEVSGSLDNKSAINTSLGFNTNSYNPVVTFVLPTLLSGKIGYDLSSQLYYRQDIFDIYEKFENFVKVNGITSLSNARLYTFFSEKDIQTILMFEDWARNSYSSWLKPWNWTPVQRDSYKKVELLVMILLYGSLFSAPGTINGQNIIEHVRKTCCIISNYPLLHGDKIIDEIASPVPSWERPP